MRQALSRPLVGASSRTFGAKPLHSILLQSDHITHLMHRKSVVDQVHSFAKPKSWTLRARRGLLTLGEIIRNGGRHRAASTNQRGSASFCRISSISGCLCTLWASTCFIHFTCRLGEIARRVWGRADCGFQFACWAAARAGIP